MLFYMVTEQFVSRLVYSEFRSSRSRWAQDGPVAGSMLVEAVANGSMGKGERGACRGAEEAWKTRWKGAPSQRRTINHRDNSIDGSLLFEGASDACQTYLVKPPAKRSHSFLHFVPRTHGAFFVSRSEVDVLRSRLIRRTK